MELDFASFGVYSLAGKRHANEDRWVAFTHLHLCPNISAPAWQLKKKKKKKKGSKGGDGGKEEKSGNDDQADEGGYLPLSFFAVYDGHGGSLCVETVSTRLHKYIINQRTRGLFFLRDPELINEALIREAIRRGFEDMDREVIRTTEQKGDSSGSCAVVIILLYNRVFIAHAGDTRAVLGQVKGSGKGSLSEPFSPLPTRLYGAELKKTNSDSSIPGHIAQGGMMSSKSADSVTPRRWERRMSDEDRRVAERGKWTRKTLKNLRTIELTEDHKATNEKEKKRMKLKGGFVANGRVFGVLAVARAFGDRSLKMSPQEYQIRKIKGSGSVMRRNRDADALSDEHSSSSDDDDNNEKNESDNHKNESDNGGGNESGAVSTDVVATEERTAAAATGESATAERRASRRVTQQRGKELNAGLPFDNDELWGWVESQRLADLRAATDFEADEKARKAEKKAAKEKERAGAASSSSSEGHADADAGGGGGGGDGASPRHENGDGEGDGEGEKAKGGKKGRKGESYEAMTEKEMRRRQDKALKKRSKQIRKEREQLKEKERKVKEMAKIQERRGNAGEGVVVALPDIDCRTISTDDRFILIASDGLWDVCPSKESVKAVSQLYLEQQLQAAATPVVAAPAQSGVPVTMLRNICESVCRSARKGGSSDDITCLLIALHPTII